MKATHRILALIAALILTFSMAGRVSAAESDTSAVIQQMINYYRYHQDAAQTDIARLNAQLAEIDEVQGEKWARIMDYWAWVNRDMIINPDILPDGLPEDDSLCIVVLGYALNRDGSMQGELIGRLEAALASAEKYPNAFILCTGGGTARNNPYATEAGRMAKWLTEQGIEEHRIIVEDDSQTTVQNARFSCQILSEQYPEVTHLAMITSDYHLPRGHVLFFAQSVLSNYGYEIVGNAAYRTGYEWTESLTQHSSDLAQLTGFYMGNMEEPALSRLTGITVSGDTVCEAGGILNLSVTASYDSGFSRDVTGSSFITGFDPELEGIQTATLTYTENGAEASAAIDIEVLPRPTEAPAETQSPTEPTAATIPEPVPAAVKEPLSPVYPVALMVVLIILLVIIIRKRKK